MTKKWHKNCGGRVEYQKPLEPTYFNQAGYCMRCGEFPIVEENIIFKVPDGYEILIGEKWEIISKEQILRMENDIDLS